MSTPEFEGFRWDKQKDGEWPTKTEISEATLELIEARKRARLSVLKLTDKDRWLLKEMKIAI